MNRKEAIKIFQLMKKILSIPNSDAARTIEAIDMAIEALQAEPIRCGECKHQDECEEVVLFDANDEEVMGHRLHWCSYGERREK